MRRLAEHDNRAEWAPKSLVLNAGNGPDKPISVPKRVSDSSEPSVAMRLEGVDTTRRLDEAKRAGYRAAIGRRTSSRSTWRLHPVS
jgi:hypothetical protein